MIADRNFQSIYNSLNSPAITRYLLHPLQLVSDLERRIRLRLDLFHLDPWRKLSQGESANFPVYLEHALHVQVSTNQYMMDLLVDLLNQ